LFRYWELSVSILFAATDVLRMYSTERREVTVTDLVESLAMPKSNASRLLRTMRDAGLLESIGTSKRYRPSLLLHQVGHIYRFATSLIDRADAVVTRIAARLGHTSYVSVRRGTDVVGVTAHPGRHMLRVVTTVGDQIPAFASSTGRALLARMSDAEVRTLYENGLPASPSNAPKTIEALLKQLARVRRNGFAEARDEAVRGVDAISVAVGDPANGDEVALCVACPITILSEQERSEIIQLLCAGAAEIAALTKDPRFIPLKISFSELTT
jgi:DNA-binding IclR family transcriptional regulator